MNNKKTVILAESDFRESFERLKANKPVQLPLNSRVTQNNVAREAGRDPSALRKSRYPTLIRDIQAWNNTNLPNSQISKYQIRNNIRQKNRPLKEIIKELKLQRDLAVSKLIEADAKILDQAYEISRLHEKLPSSNVSPIR